MKSNKIVGVAEGRNNDDAVNMKQYNSLGTNIITLSNLLTTINTSVNNISTSINNIKTQNGYYYFTRDLKHDNEKNVLFPRFFKAPFSTTSSRSIDFQIRRNGFYHIIYNDNYKNSGTLYVRETHSKKSLFQQSFNNSSAWIPITVNAVIRVAIPQGYGYANLHFGFGLNSSGILDGAGYSTFFIKYIGEL